MKVEIYKKEDSTEVYLTYIPEIIALIKSIEGAKYSALPIKKWTLPTAQLENLVTLLEQNAVQIEYVSDRKVLHDRSNKENNSVQISMDDFQFHVKLPVPKPLFEHLFDVPKRITFEKFVIDNENFPSFFKFCFIQNVRINLI